MKRLIQFFKDEDGVTAIEYGLIAALIGVAIVFTVATVGNELNDTFNAVKDELESANGSGT